MRNIIKIISNNLQKTVLLSISVIGSIIIVFTAKDYPLFSFILWLLSIFTLIFAYINFKKIKFSRNILYIFIVFVIALIVRIFLLDKNPYWIHGDEGEISTGAVNLLTGESNDFFGLHLWYYPTLWPILQTPFLAIFGANSLYGARFLAALVGATSVALIYLFTNRLYGKYAAIFASIILLLNPPHWHFSRLALDNISTPLFEVLILFFAYLGLKKRFYFVFFGLVFALSFNFYPANRIFMGLIPIGAILLLLFKKISFKGLMFAILYSFVGFFIGFAPYIISYVQTPYFFLPRNSVFQLDVIELIKLSPMQVNQLTVSMGRLFYDLFQEGVRSDFYPSRFFDWFTFIILCFSPILLCIKKYRFLYIYNVICFIAILVVGGLLTGESNTRIFGVIIYSTFIIVMLFDWFLKILQKRKVITPVIYTGILCLIFIILSSLGLHALNNLNNSLNDGPRRLADQIKNKPNKIYYYLTMPQYGSNHGVQKFLARSVIRKDIKSVSDIDTPKNNAVLIVFPDALEKIQQIKNNYTCYEEVNVGGKNKVAFKLFYLCE